MRNWIWDGSGAAFYALVTLASKDQEFAERRQLFLTEQGYSYRIIEAQALETLIGNGGSAVPPSALGGPDNPGGMN